MTSSEQPVPDGSARRLVVYAAVVVALVVVVLALIEGGERDLWSREAGWIQLVAWVLG